MGAKECVICGKPFNCKTVDNTCSEECRIERKKITDNAKAKRFRLRHKDDPDYIRRKKLYDYKNCDIFKCSECGKEIKMRIIDIKKKQTNICSECITKGESKGILMASRSKARNNTSGFIGVYYESYYDSKEPRGFKSQITKDKSIIFKNRYKDEQQTEKTLIQAVVDRDLFIIEKDLPHTRNLSDEELFGNMLMLGYEQVNKIKELLKDKR